MSGEERATISVEEIRTSIAGAMRPAHFYIGRGIRLEWEHVAREEIRWQLFHGRLLDASQTRQQQAFEAWNVFRHDSEGRSAEPLLSVKLDADGQRLHIT